jgi:septum formation protein
VTGHRVLWLASTSPQRTAILRQLGILHEIVAPNFEEDDRPDADPVELVRGHALGKARSVWRPGTLVLGVDTTVALDGRIYAKPADRADAAAMLGALQGRTHEVVSGVCLVGDGFEELQHATTRVTFRPLTAAQIETYLDAKEWKGRAGAYAIQGKGAAIVERIDGDYLNVVGLPATLLVELLAARAPGLTPLG